MSAPTVNTGPAELNIEVYAGDANEVPLEFLAADDPWDITGAVITAQARKTKTDPEVAIEADVTITDAPNGLALMAWDGEDVRTLLAGETSWQGGWDLQILELGKTLPVTKLAGTFSAELDVTHEETP